MVPSLSSHTAKTDSTKRQTAGNQNAQNTYSCNARYVYDLGTSNTNVETAFL